jgi:hypothetical protein
MKPTFARRFIIISSFSLAVLVFSLHLVARSFNWQQYRNKQYRFTILLPAGWQREEGPSGTVILVRDTLKGPQDKFQENINVVVNTLPAVVSLETFFETNKEEIISRLPGVSNVSEGGIFAGIYPGRWLIFNTQLQTVTLRIMTSCWMKDDRVYVVTCTAPAESFRKYEPIFKKVIHSLRPQ